MAIRKNTCKCPKRYRTTFVDTQSVRGKKIYTGQEQCDRCGRHFTNPRSGGMIAPYDFEVVDAATMCIAWRCHRNVPKWREWCDIHLKEMVRELTT